jgi:hypothetical protein
MINNRTRRKTCWKTGKIRYSQDQAERAAKATARANWKRGDLRPMNHYACRYCEKWHVGHERQGD